MQKVKISILKLTKVSRMCTFNPLPHGVLATFFPTAGGPMDPPKKEIKDDSDDITADP
jgi:hypothetical protein